MVKSGPRVYIMCARGVHGMVVLHGLGWRCCKAYHTTNLPVLPAVVMGVRTQMLSTRFRTLHSAAPLQSQGLCFLQVNVTASGVPVNPGTPDRDRYRYRACNIPPDPSWAPPPGQINLTVCSGNAYQYKQVKR